MWLKESKNGIPLDYYANNLINKIIKEDFTLVISDVLIQEVTQKHLFVKEEFKYLTQQLSKMNKLMIIESDNQLKRAAKNKTQYYIGKNIKAHINDVIQILIAKQENALFVTNDKEAREIAIEEGLEVMDLDTPLC